MIIGIVISYFLIAIFFMLCAPDHPDKTMLYNKIVTLVLSLLWPLTILIYILQTRGSRKW